MGKRKVQNYTEEFKQSSAKLAATSEQPISHTADELGIHPSTLHGWVQKYYPQFATHDKSSPTIDALTAELALLRKENIRLKQERDILKKAAAYFASEAQ
jgi:transposase